jgi:hypothetical protein
VARIGNAFLGLSLGLMLPLASAKPMAAADLSPRTAAAFDRYAAETENQSADSLADDKRFLWVDRQPAADRQTRLKQLRSGGFIIERLWTKASGKDIDVPDGMIHHWLGTVFVPGVSADRAIALLQDYDRHAEIYKPAVARSKTLGHSGDTFKVNLRFFMKKGITVVVDGEHEARFTRASPTRAYSRIVSTRLNEIDDAGTPNEREKPVGQDSGYLWRINSYWRFLERDGGTYIQCETITLSRGIPFGLGWVIGPFVTGIPKESLEFTLTTTRTALLAR